MDFCAESIHHDELTIKLMKTETSWLWSCGTTFKSSTVSTGLGPDRPGSASQLGLPAGGELLTLSEFLYP